MILSLRRLARRRERAEAMIARSIAHADKKGWTKLIAQLDPDAE